MLRKDWPPSAANALAKIAERVEMLTDHSVSWTNPPHDLAEKIAFACTNIRTLQLVVSSKVKNRHAWHQAFIGLKSKGVCATFICVDDAYAISTTCPPNDLRVIVITGDERAHLAPLTPNCRLGMCFVDGKEAEWLMDQAREWMATWLD